MFSSSQLCSSKVCCCLARCNRDYYFISFESQAETSGFSTKSTIKTKQNKDNSSKTSHHVNDVSICKHKSNEDLLGCKKEISRHSLSVYLKSIPTSSAFYRARCTLASCLLLGLHVQHNKVWPSKQKCHNLN